MTLVYVCMYVCMYVCIYADESKISVTSQWLTDKDIGVNVISSATDDLNKKNRLFSCKKQICPAKEEYWKSENKKTKLFLAGYDLNACLSNF